MGGRYFRDGGALVFTYQVIDVDVENALADELVNVNGWKVIVLEVDDDTATIRVSDKNADPIPAKATLEFCSERGELIGRLFFDADGTGAAGDSVTLLVIRRGNAALFSG